MQSNSKSNGLLPIARAVKIINDTIVPISKYGLCTLDKALDRVIAKDIESPVNVPSFDNSAMDGFALKFSDLATNTRLVLVGKSFAGKPYTRAIKVGQCVGIMTGAEIPEGADTVVMKENTQADGDTILFTHKVSKGDAIRKAGGDIVKGAIVLPKGSRVSALNIGLMASLGYDQIPVFDQLKVAIFSTGDELQPPGEAPSKGKIYDSNRPMLVAMARRIGADVIDLGNIPDNKELIRAAFEKADKVAHCVITSGGVSVGEADFTKEVLSEYGEIDFWKLAIKPGKPLAFGRLDNSIFFGLPGNPVSAAVTFDQIAVPALDVLSGSSSYKALQINAKATSQFKKRPGRTDYQRATYSYSEQGELLVKAADTQSSGVLSSFSKSNCYAVLESERGLVEKGEQVVIQPFGKVIN